MEKDVITYSALLRIFISSLIGLAGGIAAYSWIDNTLFTLLVVSIPLSLATLVILIFKTAQDRLTAPPADNRCQNQQHKEA